MAAGRPVAVGQNTRPSNPRTATGGPPRTGAAPVPRALRIYLPFACAYFLSYTLRTINAVVSPELSRELDLGPAALGLLTSAYFLAFCAVQLPNGLLLDRYGPRRTEAALLLFTAVGCGLFALGESLLTLTLARALIGLGVSACLMGSLKAISLWFPQERQPSMANWIMVAGALGAVATTTPVEFAIQHISWRWLFAAVCAATLMASAYLFLTVPDPPTAGAPASLGRQWQGVVGILRSPRFWWIVPVASVPMGCYMAIQSLWAVPWMMEVEGMTRAQAAHRLFVLAVVQLLCYFTLSLAARPLARHGIQPRHIYAAGCAVHVLGIIGMVVPTPLGRLPMWIAMTLGASVNVLSFSVFTEGLGKELVGRAATAMNQVLFALCFALQWGIGALVESLMALGGMSKPAAFVATFACLAVAQSASYLWFAAGWKRFSRAAPAAAAA